MASGPGTVLDEVLRMVGGENAAARRQGRSRPTYDREKLLALAPDVILLIQPGTPPRQKRSTRTACLAEFRSLDIPAVKLP